MELAQQAPSRRLAQAVALSISQTARQLLELCELLSQMDQAIVELVKQVSPDNVLESIPGIGPATAACILAEVVDIAPFESKREFVGYCGLYPTVWQSGQGLRHAHMTYKGNRMLKLALLFISAVVCQHNAVFAAYYKRLWPRGESRRAALGAVARKLAEVVSVLLSRGERWDEEKAWAGVRNGERMATSTTRAEQPMCEGVSQGATHDSAAVAPASPAAEPDSPAEESSDEDASQDAGAGATPRGVAEPRGAGEGGGGPVAAVLPGKRSRAGDDAPGRRHKPMAVAGKRVRLKEGAAQRL